MISSSAMTTTKGDEESAKFDEDPTIAVDDPIRVRVLLAVALVCLGQVAATIVPDLGSVAARVTIALAASCLGWLAGGAIVVAARRRRWTCRECRRRIDAETVNPTRARGRDDGDRPDRSCERVGPGERASD